jgi:uncharacterized membrane protein HdeD (DUF308 family)
MLIAHVVAFLLCMGVAKAINASRKSSAVNGAGIYLTLAALSFAFSIYTFANSGHLAEAIGRLTGGTLPVVAVAAYCFRKFRWSKAEDARVGRPRVA